MKLLLREKSILGFYFIIGLAERKSIKTLLAIVCIVLSIKSYKSKGKQAINNGLDKVQKSVV